MPMSLVGSYDPLSHKTLEDLRYLTQHEIDLYEEGQETDNGYGQFMIAGKVIRPHRYSYQTFVGDIGDLHVLHRCDNRVCVNPDHLFLGTTNDNQKDKTEKDRQAKGENVGTSVLTDEDVIEIRRRYSMRRGKHDRVNGQGVLARAFGVTQANISEIVRRKTWRHI